MRKEAQVGTQHREGSLNIAARAGRTLCKGSSDIPCRSDHHRYGLYSYFLQYCTKHCTMPIRTAPCYYYYYSSSSSITALLLLLFYYCTIAIIIIIPLHNCTTSVPRDLFLLGGRNCVAGFPPPPPSLAGPQRPFTLRCHGRCAFPATVRAVVPTAKRAQSPPPPSLSLPHLAEP
jgi:hypothetical protein